MRRPFNFIHDINGVYFRFANQIKFYNDPGYSEEFVKRNGWQFDGQIFYKKEVKK